LRVIVFSATRDSSVEDGLLLLVVCVLFCFSPLPISRVTFVARKPLPCPLTSLLCCSTVSFAFAVSSSGFHVSFSVRFLARRNNCGGADMCRRKTRETKFVQRASCALTHRELAQERKAKTSVERNFALRSCASFCVSGRVKHAAQTSSLSFFFGTCPLHRLFLRASKRTEKETWKPDQETANAKETVEHSNEVRGQGRGLRATKVTREMGSGEKAKQNTNYQEQQSVFDA